MLHHDRQHKPDRGDHSMRTFALQLTAITTFALGLIWFAGEGGAIPSNDLEGARFASGEQFAAETLQINVDELNSDQAETKKPNRRDVYRQSKKIYETIMDIRNRYMDEIDIEELVDAGIRGMLQNLDRYSVLMERKSYDNLMEHTSGKYEGLGMQIDARNDRIVIIAPLEGGPSEKLGLRAGDMVMEIEGESTFEMTTSAASKLMRGKAGTSINIKVKREGIADLMAYDIERAVITLHSVNYAGKIPGTDMGYLRLSTFASNSRRELRAAIKKLNAEGISGLVFDLRSNGGGLLDQAWATAELFVPKNSLVVYTQGQEEDSRKDYYTRRDPLFPNKPLIVLVDEGTASASEIVAGAIQDLDRGIVMGRTTFGKGLVQQVFAFDDDPDQHLKLTTARYYVPSGRSIQRLDRQGKYDPKHSEIDLDSLKIEDREEFQTLNGRVVYGGGGIVPDIESIREYWKPIAINMRRKSLFFDFASKYLADHSEVTLDTEISDEIMDDFRNFVKDKDFDYKTSLQIALEEFEDAVNEEEQLDEFKSQLKSLGQLIDKDKSDDFDESYDDIKLAIKRELVSHLGGEKARYERYILPTVPAIQQAVEILQDAKEYTRILTEGAHRAAVEDTEKDKSDSD